MDPIAPYTMLILWLNAQLDAGHRLDPSDVQQRLENRELFPWLYESLPRCGMARLSEPDQEEVMETLREAAVTFSPPKATFAVSRNGLAILLAFCIHTVHEVRLKEWSRR